MYYVRYYTGNDVVILGPTIQLSLIRTCLMIRSPDKLHHG